MPTIGSGRVTPGTGQVSFKDETTTSTGTTPATGSSSSTIPAETTIRSVTGMNIGGGIGMFAGTSGGRNAVLEFKTLVAGSGVVITEDADNIFIRAAGGAGGSGVTTFVELLDGPGRVVRGGLLMGKDASTLDFTPTPTATGQVLTWNGSAYVWQVPTTSGGGNGGTVSLTGQNGVQVSGSNGTYTAGLSTVAVTPGSYQSASIVVDAYGRVIAATANTLQNGSVTSVQVASPDNSIIVAGAPITRSGRIDLSLAATGVTPGTYSNASFVVDASGRISQAVSLGTANGTVTAVDLRSDGSISVSGGPVTQTGTFVVGLVPTTVTAGTYSNPVIAVDAYGRIVSAQNGTAPSPGGGTGSGSGTVTSVTATSTGGITITGGPITSAGTLTFSLAASSVTPGTYSNASFVVDATGRITAATSQPAPSFSFDAVASEGLSVETSRITNGGTLSVGLATVPGLTAGTYGNLTVDTYGRITNVTTVVEALTDEIVSADSELFTVKATEGAILFHGDVEGEKTVTGRIVSNSQTDANFTIDLSEVSEVAFKANSSQNDDVDVRIVAQGDGVVFIGNDQEQVTPSVIQALPEQSLIIAAGDSNAVSVGKTLVLRGGFGIDQPGNVSVSDQRITNVAAPVQGTDAVNKAYLDTALLGVGGGTSGGTVTSVGATGSADIGVTGGPITTTGSLTLALLDTAVVAGTYSNFAVDAKGRLTSARAISAADVNAALGFTPLSSAAARVTSVAATGTNGVSVTGGPITSAGTLTIGLSPSGVTAGTYGTLVVDTYGRITSAAIPAAAVTSVAATGSNGITVTGGPITSTGTLAFSLAPSGVTAGTYAHATVTVDTYGRVTGIAAGAAGGTVTSVAAAGSADITVTGGPVTTAGTLTFGLADTTVVAGTYGQFTVDAKGRLTAARAMTSADVTGALGFTPANVTDLKSGTVTSVAAAGSADITVTGGPVTTSGTLTFALANTTVTAGTYGQFAVDAKGRLTGARNITSADVTGALGFTPANAATTGTVRSVAAAGTNGITVSGGPVTNSGTLSIGLAATGAAAGSYTNANITVDAYGRITAVANGPAPDGSGAISLSGDVTGSVDQNGDISATLAPTGVTPGTYSNATVVVDAKGRVTNVQQGIGGGGTLPQNVPTIYTFRVALIAANGQIDVDNNPVTDLPEGWTVSAMNVAMVTINVGSPLFTMPKIPHVYTAGANTSGNYNIRVAGTSTAVTCTVNNAGTTIMLASISATNTGANQTSNNHFWVKIVI